MHFSALYTRIGYTQGNESTW